MDGAPSFAEWLRRRRKAFDLTQAALARKVQYSTSTIRKLEAGDTRPSHEIAERLAVALEVPPAERAAFLRFARLWPQAAAPALAAWMSPPVPGEARPGSLPQQATPCIGREDSLALIAAYLARADCRLITVIGPGGIGKTRVVLEAGARSAGYADSVFLVALAGVGSSQLLPSAIADALGLPQPGGSDPVAQLVPQLRARRMLLLLDNFEHLLDGVGLLAAILEQAPGVKLLVSSRQRLNLREEWLLPLHGLQFPDGDLAVRPASDYSAVQLFIQRAAQVRPGFTLSPDLQPAVLRICRLLEGSPLGIELAAAWTRLLPCAEIAAEIAANLDFLTTTARNVPARQRSLRAAFEHSWMLLSTLERRVFARLAVFRGGFNRAAAEAVCADIGGYAQSTLLTELAALCDKSLVYPLSAGCYDLHEALRQYAEEKLREAGELELAQDRHCHYYMARLEYRSENELLGRLKDLLVAVDMAADIDNVRAAWGYAVQRGALTDIRVWLESIFHLYESRGLFGEGADSCEQLAQRVRRMPVDEVARRAVLGHALTIKGWFHFLLGLHDTAEACAREGAQWLGAAVDLAERASNLLLLGTLANIRKQPLEAQQFLRECLAVSPAIGQQLPASYALVGLGLASAELGDLAQARQYLLDGLQILERLGHQIGIGYCLLCLGDVARALGELDEARQRYLASLAVRSEISGHWIMARSHARLGSLAQAAGDLDEARQRYQAGLAICTALHHQRGMAVALGNLGRVAYAQHDYAAAGHLHRESLALSRECSHQRGIVVSLTHLGQVSCALGAYQEARAQLSEALHGALEIGATALALDVLLAQAELETQTGHLAQAAERLALALEHSAIEPRARARAELLIGSLAQPLGPEVMAAAQERARAQCLAQPA
jgi:predicted ATPase/transcriptional regulator with XRE-family HTH domain